MPETLQNIATELENLQKIKSKMKNAMIYPMVVLFIACIAVYILLVHVMPSIVKMFPNKETLP
jgi:type II secretory pathway component PulF